MSESDAFEIGDQVWHWNHGKGEVVELRPFKKLLVRFYDSNTHVRVKRQHCKKLFKAEAVT